jgi:HSP20 family protein
MKNLVNYNPFGVSKFFDDFFNRDITDFFGSDGSLTLPSVNVVENEKSYRIEVAAPGLEKDDFNLEVDKNMLIISAKKEASDEVEEDNYMRREFNYTSFNRTFQLPEGVNADEIGAKYDNGVLHVTLPKLEEMQAAPTKRIEIS